MNFSQIDLHPNLQKGISSLGYTEPTPVQEAVIPEALLGHDIRASAQTGTGKTLAFVAPILDKLLREPSVAFPSVLVVVPTRELGTQVNTVFHDVGKFSAIKTVLILGGADFDRQLKQLRAGAQIVVATPGRLLDHMRRHTLSLKNIETLVLDEADRMLDMGFLPDIRSICAACPPKRRTMLFSATFPLEIQRLVSSFLKDPKTIDVSPTVASNSVTQMVYPISTSQKEAFLLALLESGNITSALIFCRTKHGSDRLATSLKKIGKSVGVIHSDRSQNERNQALLGFKMKTFQILVATDIASRGIDIKDISHVINYDVPHHPEDYVHRIGRTGRAQATGDAFTLVTPSEEPYLMRIEKFISKTLPRGVLPDFPYLVPPRLTSKPNSFLDRFGKMRRRIPSAQFRRFR